MNKELLSIALSLEKHPILSEKSNYKIKYLNVLEYFVNKYSKEDVFANEVLNIYKKKILGGLDYCYKITDINKAVKSTGSYKLKGFKLFSYRYNLLMDCLLINAQYNKNNAEKIKEEVKNIFSKRYHKKIDTLYNALYSEEIVIEDEMLSNQINSWKKNMNYLNLPMRKILITANMSAGKSTLINALIGKKINKTQNDSCTAKIHYIFNKPYEDGYSYELDYELDLDADLKTLMEDNINNKESEISVGTYFRTNINQSERICIIDTPGVNSALDKKHRDLSYKLIEENNYDILVCVMNASNIGTFDDQNHIKYLSENVKNKKIIFVINQLDKFDKDEDSIEECITKVQNDINSYGFENAIICPVSAYAGMLAKKQLYDDDLTEFERLELQMYILKFKDDYSTMKKFFLFNNEEINDQNGEESLYIRCLELLNNSGLVNLEKILFE